MRKRVILYIFLLFGCFTTALSQHVTVSGTVFDEDSKEPVEFASLLMKESGFWAITDADGTFTIKNIPTGKATLTVQCLGYAKREIVMTVKRDIPNLRISLKPENLKLEEVTVTAKRKRDEAATSFTIDRTALDNQQVMNLGDISTLLPGGKTVNPSLMDDNRMALRSGGQEKGNASFGTAVEVDGIRLSNNAETDETLGASTRSVSTSNIESVEIVTGVPSVEYGDLSNGVVKVNTRKGKSPYIIEGKLNQHTRQIALNKGFDLGGHNGVLNASFEHARSFKDAASPHTAYQRNILSLHYMNIFMRQSTPLTLNIGLTGNIGGFSTEADPDQELDDYMKTRDNVFRGNFELNWLLNKSWITNLSLRGSISMSDRTTKEYLHKNSATTLSYVHATEEGYFMATDYDKDPNAPVILGLTGYWHRMSYVDSKPLDYSLRMKADWTHRFGKVMNRLMIGAEYTGSKNNGRGNYFEDRRYADRGWREYRYDELPTLNNLALYAEEKISIPTTKHATFELTAGVRDDLTLISGSDYGTVSSISPRFNARYIFWKNRRKQFVSDLSIHAGWGKSVKLPSFQVLFPRENYYDEEVFKSPSTATNTTISAWYTRPSKAIYNPELKWQYTNQTDIGFEMNVKGTHISLSAFHHRTHNPYMATNVYTPFSYQYTALSALDHCSIASADRTFTIDRQTGMVTVLSTDGTQREQLAADTRYAYIRNTRYVNASPLNRYGLEWMIDFTPIKALRTSIRLDGNYYYYKGLDDILFADVPVTNAMMMGSANEPYRYVGWYRGSNATSTSYTADASVSNGSLSKQLNLNATITTHIPKIRLIVALRIESTLYNYQRSLCELSDGPRGIALEDNASFFGKPYDASCENQYVAVYPEYYSTWEHPDEKLPFLEHFLQAKENDPTLYNDLAKLVVRSNYPYVLNPNRISSYYSANLSITKEIGDHVSVSFYANNFFNNMKTVHSSQTGLDTSLFSSSYIPSYYYGLSLRLKL